MIVEYCQCVDLMPMLTTDIMTKLFELMKVSVNNALILSKRELMT